MKTHLAVCIFLTILAGCMEPVSNTIEQEASTSARSVGYLTDQLVVGSAFYESPEGWLSLNLSAPAIISDFQGQSHEAQVLTVERGGSGSSDRASFLLSMNGSLLLMLGECIRMDSCLDLYPFSMDLFGIRGIGGAPFRFEDIKEEQVLVHGSPRSVPAPAIRENDGCERVEHEKIDLKLRALTFYPSVTVRCQPGAPTSILMGEWFELVDQNMSAIGPWEHAPKEFLNPGHGQGQTNFGLRGIQAFGANASMLHLLSEASRHASIDSYLEQNQNAIVLRFTQEGQSTTSLGLPFVQSHPTAMITSTTRSYQVDLCDRGSGLSFTLEHTYSDLGDEVQTTQHQAQPCPLDHPEVVNTNLASLQEWANEATGEPLSSYHQEYGAFLGNPGPFYGTPRDHTLVLHYPGFKFGAFELVQSSSFNLESGVMFRAVLFEDTLRTHFPLDPLYLK